MKKLVIYRIAFFMGLGVFAGCSTVAQEAAPVQRVVVGTRVPSTCQLRGAVSSGSAEYAVLTAVRTIQARQMIIIQNQALRLGANAIQLSEHGVAYYGQYIIPTGRLDYGLDVRAMVGNAYFCRPSELREIYPFHLGG